MALIQYHIANGTHPSATFGLQPLFVPTLLTNSNYTNVTGGQVVEIATLNNTPTIVTGVKATSQVVEAVSTRVVKTISNPLMRPGHFLSGWPHPCPGFSAHHSNILSSYYYEGWFERPCRIAQQRRLAQSKFTCREHC